MTDSMAAGLKMTSIALFAWILLVASRSPAFGAQYDSNPAQANTVSQVDSEDRTRVSLQPSYYRMTNDSGFVLSGIEVDAGMTFAAGDGTAFGARFGQAYAFEETASALFTLIAIEMEYAITGSLVRRHSSTNLYGSSVFTNTSAGARGFRGTVKVNQYYINTAKSAVPLSGGGIGFFYELPVWRTYNAKLGAEVDTITNGDFETSPMKVYLGVVSVTN
jgi:hypothetical protein